MKVATVKFKNYGRIYSFYTKLGLVEGRSYKIATRDGTYGTPVEFTGYVPSAPAGIPLKEIIEAEEVEEEENA